MMKPLFPLIISLLAFGGGVYAQNFQLNKSGYFQDKGVDVMAFDDIYPEGHQGGVSLIMHGHRIATNGDRFPSNVNALPIPKREPSKLT